MYKKTKLFICLLISIYTLMLSVAFASQVTINTQILNIRENPNTNSAIVGKVKQNEKYDIIEESNNWIKITKDNIVGWICKDYVIVSQTQINTDTQVQVSQTTQKIVTANRLNVRDNASINTNVIGSLSLNEIVEVLETSNGWDKVKTQNTFGWVSNMYLALISNNNEAKNEEVTLERSIKITANKLNIRSSASTNSNVIGTIPFGTVVTAIGQENEWYKIRYGSGYGYISSQYTVVSDQVASRGGYTRQNNDIASQLADKAHTFLGYKYVYGAESPKDGFDCSGLVYYLYKDYVSNLPRTASKQANMGVYVERANLQKGDLIFFTQNAGTNVTHVGIYYGDGYFVHAANSNRGVVIDTITTGNYNKNYLFGRRLI